MFAVVANARTYRQLRCGLRGITTRERLHAIMVCSRQGRALGVTKPDDALAKAEMGFVDLIRKDGSMVLCPAEWLEFTGDTMTAPKVDQ